MSQTFHECLAIVLGHEGGDSSDPRDPGGLTRYGISQTAHPGVDVKNLTRELAAEIYRKHYWEPMGCSRMPAPVALCVFDGAVNQGTNAMARLLQECAGTTVDGIIGDYTIAVIARRPPIALVKRIMTARVKRYLKTGGFATFGAGWLARCIDITATAAEWAAGPGD